ncbi:hypothetical protein [Aquimarina sp. AU474]|uniref:hypothetical protein n=1 Tax=Aquimarina sp. AU474 TaxID=2108529 RepID=UPI000D69C70D|nr:hypothetical protein [Aquimarina sp. AU474]
MKTATIIKKTALMISSTRLIIILILSILITSCEGEDGEIGPEGLQGEQGLPGETGTANVIYSEWIDTEFGDNITNINVAFEFDAPEINTNILNSGTILVYGRTFDTTNGVRVYQLPLTVGVGSSRLSYLFIVSTGKIEIRINSSEVIGNNDFIQQYRYVIIPGGESATSSVNHSKMSYQEIANKFTIKD